MLTFTATEDPWFYWWNEDAQLPVLRQQQQQHVASVRCGGLGLRGRSEQCRRLSPTMYVAVVLAAVTGVGAREIDCCASFGTAKCWARCGSIWGGQGG